MTINCSLIITTYNWPAALDSVLQSVAEQYQQPYEVIIADDGSREDTLELVQQWQKKAPFKLLHVWQEDNGFQAARIRNKATLTATGNYIIFLDGDCLLRPDFIQKHIQLAQPGFFVAGNRALLSESFTPEVLAKQLNVGSWPRSRFTQEQLNRSWPLRYIPLGPLRKLGGDKWQGVKTCNLAIWKEDLIAVNGLDESFIGWGYEDSELVIRLLRRGVKRLNGRLATTVLHLWHREHDRSQEQENWLRLQDVLNSDKRHAIEGLEQHASTDH